MIEEESVLEALIFLFESADAQEERIASNRQQAKDALLKAGFYITEIQKAFIWLDELVLMQEQGREQKYNCVPPIRIYDGYECEKLGVECRGLIMQLEQLGVLNVITREWVIDRAMALEDDYITPEQIKFVTLLVLFNCPEFREEYDWMEDYIYFSASGILH